MAEENGGGTQNRPEDGNMSPGRDKTEGEREQIKLQATYLNGVAIGLFLIGGLSIPSTILLNSGRVLLAIAVAFFCFFASFGLHKLAKRSLRELDR